MPTAASAPVTFTHSWSFVYLKSVGYMQFCLCEFRKTARTRSPPLARSLRARPLVKRLRDDFRPQAPAAHVDLERRADGGERRRDHRESNRLLQERGLLLARDGPH